MTTPTPEQSQRDASPMAEATMPTGQWCPIGPLNAHTYNHERTECIWCGPNGLAWKPGRWVPQGDGTNAWSATPTSIPEDES